MASGNLEMKTVLFFLVILSMFASTGCSLLTGDVRQTEENSGLTGKAAEQTREEARQSLEAAMAAQNRADSLEGGWISTDKLINKAKAALARGDHALALKLAKKAKVEAELAYKQAKHERDHWLPPPYAR